MASHPSCHLHLLLKKKSHNFFQREDGPTTTHAQNNPLSTRPKDDPRGKTRRLEEEDVIDGKSLKMLPAHTFCIEKVGFSGWLAFVWFGRMVG